MTADNHKPRVYCASKLMHSFMWRNWRDALDCINIISTWHNDPEIESKETDVDQCIAGWKDNRLQILHEADHLLVYANRHDRLNGTLVEVGMAYAMNIPIHLIGTFPWGTWRHSDLVHVHSSLSDALIVIVNYAFDQRALQSPQRSTDT